MNGNCKGMISSHQISKKYNLSYQTINYYTNLGLLVVKKRKGNGRLYKNKHVKERLSRITSLKDIGYPFRIIHKML